jgi:hypothetical protein
MPDHPCDYLSALCANRWRNPFTLQGKQPEGLLIKLKSAALGGIPLADFEKTYAAELRMSTAEYGNVAPRRSEALYGFNCAEEMRTIRCCGPMEPNFAVGLPEEFMPRARQSVSTKTIALAIFILLLFAIGCGGNATGSGSPGGTIIPQNAVPIIGSLNPNSVTAGASAFTLTITGENFISSSTVQWNGSPRTTTYSSSSQLQAQVTASDIASSGFALVSVTNPVAGGGSAEFTINATSNALPSLTSLNPSSILAGSSAFILTVNGDNFVTASTIEWNGTALPTTYLSGTQLEAQIPESDVTSTGFADVAVLNPALGGGVSTPVVFAIAFAPTVVRQASNDLVWDATHQLIYLSVP